MGSIEQYRAMSPQRGVSRQVGRALGHVDGQTAVDMAIIEARADLQAAQVDAMTAVTARSLQGVGFLASVEMTLADACPAAMTRLKLVGDAGTMALTSITMDTATKLRRV